MTPEAALPLGMDTAAIRIALRGRNRRPPKKGHKRRQGQPARHPGQGPKARRDLPRPRFPENRIGRAIQRMDPVDLAAMIQPFPGPTRRGADPAKADPDDRQSPSALDFAAPLTEA
ncbi:hypothetical protein JMM61_10815 [Rhodovulum sulfidophilum]|uniref:hypothetical protein n=1 Tax=Rhodovulum sulfidophilum TaxID=35806 RepID=UPI0019273C95|nr:hypothetical protein [Rhodovulum sulfidophilum]MBL3585867.1 hypothetical protein [Rhodovulum sulfidophilum]